MHPAQVMGIHGSRQLPQISQKLVIGGWFTAHLHFGGAAFLAQVFPAGGGQTVVGMTDAGNYLVAAQPAPKLGVTQVHQGAMGQVHLPFQHRVVAEVEPALHASLRAVFEKGVPQCSARTLGHVQNNQLQIVINDHRRCLRGTPGSPGL